jgi:hypothetical protein
MCQTIIGPMIVYAKPYEWYVVQIHFGANPLSPRNQPLRIRTSIYCEPQISRIVHNFRAFFEDFHGKIWRTARGVVYLWHK